MKKPDPARDDSAFYTDGTPVPMNPQEVRAHVLRMMDGGDIVAAIIRDKNGDVAVQVFGPPSRELLDILKQATQGYEQALKGH